MFKDKAFNPLLKWPGGKSSEILALRENSPQLFPKEVGRYIEPFVGGGAVWLSVDANKMIVNDLCRELIMFYKMIRDSNALFFSLINKLSKNWDLMKNLAENIPEGCYGDTDKLEDYLYNKKNIIEGQFFIQDYKDIIFDEINKSVLRKVSRTLFLEEKKGKLSEEDIYSNIESGFKAGLYTAIRDIYNQHLYYDEIKVICFYVLRDFCFSSMFRYNSAGEFNVPYGGLTYNKRKPDSRVDKWRHSGLIEHLKSTDYYNLDFEKFLRKVKPAQGDFVFIDPPYDSEFSTYAENIFDIADQERLANYLIHECEAEFLAIMKNTDVIKNLYKHPTIQIMAFEKKYAVSFKSRNDRKVQHLIIKKTTGS